MILSINQHCHRNRFGGLLLTGVLFLSFAKGTNAQISTATPSDKAQTASYINAIPNPVPAGTGAGTTRITWKTGDNSVGQVRVADPAQEGPEGLFAVGTEGSQDAPWISPGSTCEFRLYTQSEPRKLLAKVTVTGSHETDWKVFAANFIDRMRNGFTRGWIASILSVVLLFLAA